MAEIMELVLSDTIYGVSWEAAVRRAATRVAEKYDRQAGEKGGKR
jgi:hypothetical protein